MIDFQSLVLLVFSFSLSHSSYCVNMIICFFVVWIQSLFDNYNYVYLVFFIALYIYTNISKKTILYLLFFVVVVCFVVFLSLYLSIYLCLRQFVCICWIIIKELINIIIQFIWNNNQINKHSFVEKKCYLKKGWLLVNIWCLLCELTNHIWMMWILNLRKIN